MNRLILKRTYSNQSEFIISEDQDVIDHLKEVLKVKVGDTIRAAFLDEGLGVVIVTATDPIIELQLEGQIEPTPTRELHLLVGVSRPPTMKKVLEHATSLGVTHFHFFKAHLSDKSYLQSKVFNEDSIEQLLKLGVAQSSKLAKLPIVKSYPSLKQALVQVPPRRFLLSLGGHKSFMNLESPKEAVALAVGPERGWTQDEEAFLQEENFVPVKISSHTLRVEIATFSALAQLEMILHGE